MLARQFYVYILTTRHNTALHIGVTNNLVRRVEEHKLKLVPGFTSKYKITKLVYFKKFPHVYDAIQREKQLKRWNRQWKIDLIQSANPEWKDLSHHL